MREGEKENVKAPYSKQGICYQLQLGKDNGPYLSKDIMHNNHKSMALLNGAESLLSHVSMANTLQEFQASQSKHFKVGRTLCDWGSQSKDWDSQLRAWDTQVKSRSDVPIYRCIKEISMGDVQVENFMDTIRFIETEIEVAWKHSEMLKLEEKQVRRDLEQMQDKLSRRNNEAYDQSMPLLKILLKKVKESGNLKNAETYTFSREISDLFKWREAIRQGIAQCESKISRIEAYFVAPNPNSSV